MITLGMMRSEGKEALRRSSIVIRNYIMIKWRYMMIIFSPNSLVKLYVDSGNKTLINNLTNDNDNNGSREI